MLNIPEILQPYKGCMMMFLGWDFPLPPDYFAMITAGEGVGK